MRQLHADAEHNQRVLARFQTRELELLGAGQLTELLDRLTRGMRQSFAVDAIRLLLLDPFLVIHELLAGTPDMPEDALRDIELCTDIAATRGRFVDLHAPWLGPWDEHRHRPLFGRRLNGSVALLPLRQAAGLTGFLCLGSRDRTFETVSGLLDKPLPGYGELFRMLSYEAIGPAAMLSRATGGLIGRTVVLTMPGSPAAVRLALEKIILPELGHLVREAKR